MRLKKSPVPLYYQLEKVLRKRIVSGKLLPDEAFPTEKHLCQEFGVSRTTVRQALLSLEGDDIIRREQGRGTFINRRNSGEFRLRLYGAVDDLFHLGSKTTLTLSSKSLIRPDLEMAKEMKLGEGEKVFLFEGVRNLVERYAFFRAYIPEEVGQNIRLEEVDTPLFIERVEKEALETVNRALQTTTASVADDALAAILKVERGHPLLVIKRIYFSKSGRALELCVTSYPGDVYESVAELVKVDSDHVNKGIEKLEMDEET